MSRRLDLSQFRGDDSDEESAPVHKPLELDALKSKTFSLGITKKTKKDLEKEAEERRRKEEDELAKIALEEFSRTFDQESYSHGQGYGRRAGPGGGFVKAGGAPMAPAQPPRAPAAMRGFPTQPPTGPRRRSPSPPPAQKPRGKRAMDAFLEEIKNNQEAREARLGHIAKMEGSSVSALAAREGPGGSKMAFDEGETTNLFVGNLPANIDEESLGMFFAKAGPVGSVKIMWPRGDEGFSVGSSMGATRRTKAGLHGFVCFMTRSDADWAVREFDGFEWGGCVLRVMWSKPAPKPARAAYELSRNKGKRSRSRSRSRSPRRRHRSRSHSRSRSPSPTRRRGDDDDNANQRRGDRGGSRSRSPASGDRSARDYWLDKVPEDAAQFVRAVGTKVNEHGRKFEEMLREREKGNAKFDFLFDENVPAYHLYKYQLDRRYRFPDPPAPDFIDEGYASVYSTDSEEDEEKERTTKGKLGRIARKRFEAMLRAIAGKRLEIARGMEFALMRAEAADEVADIVCQSMKLDGTPVPRKIARLHLISDILHNSASPLPNVWKYRHAFERRLPEVVAHLADVHQSLLAYSGKIAAGVFRAQVEAVLTIWERWIVFNSDVSEYLQALFHGTATLAEKPGQGGADATSRLDENIEKAEAEAAEKAAASQKSKFKTSGFKSSFKPLSASTVTSIPTPVIPSAAATGPLTHQVAGASGAGDDDVDGEEMDIEEDEEDLDGEAMDEEDLDGEAM